MASCHLSFVEGRRFHRPAENFPAVLNVREPMVGGYNHNISVNGRLFHVQSELGGARNPQIVTLVYEGGTILTSCKVSYADLLEVENSREAIELRMKAQHKDMLRRLRDSELEGMAAADNPAALVAGDSGSAVQDVAESVPAADPLDELVLAYLTGNDPRYKQS